MQRFREWEHLQIRNFPFRLRLKNVIKSPANEHKRWRLNQPATNHKTKQANFQLILTRSTKAKTGNGHGPWPKRQRTEHQDSRGRVGRRELGNGTMNPRPEPGDRSSSAAHFQLSHALQISIGNKCNAKQHFKSFAESTKQHANTNKPTRHWHRNWIAISCRLYL